MMVYSAHHESHSYFGKFSLEVHPSLKEGEKAMWFGHLAVTNDSMKSSITSFMKYAVKYLRDHDVSIIYKLYI